MQVEHNKTYFNIRYAFYFLQRYNYFFVFESRIFNFIKKQEKEACRDDKLPFKNVVLGGFEPPQTEPKPVVLPLHHRTMWVQSYNFLQKQPNETAIFLETRNKYAALRFQKNPFISHLSVFQNINFH